MSSWFPWRKITLKMFTSWFSSQMASKIQSIRIRSFLQNTPNRLTCKGGIWGAFGEFEVQSVLWKHRVIMVPPLSSLVALQVVTWQPAVPPVMTNLASWQLLVLNEFYLGYYSPCNVSYSTRCMTTKPDHDRPSWPSWKSLYMYLMWHDCMASPGTANCSCLS